MKLHETFFARGGFQEGRGEAFFSFFFSLSFTDLTFKPLQEGKVDFLKVI